MFLVITEFSKIQVLKNQGKENQAISKPSFWKLSRVTQPTQPLLSPHEAENSVNMELCSIMNSVVNRDVKSSRNFTSPVAILLCLAVGQARGCCVWCNMGSVLGLGTPLKEDRAEVLWLHLFKLPIMAFRTCRFSERGCVESKRSRWIILFLFWLHLWLWWNV